MSGGLAAESVLWGQGRELGALIFFKSAKSLTDMLHTVCLDWFLLVKYLMKLILIRIVQ